MKNALFVLKNIMVIFQSQNAIIFFIIIAYLAILKTLEKKIVLFVDVIYKLDKKDNRNNIFGRQIYENNNNYMNYIFGNENNRNQNLRINQRENETNLYGNRDEQINRNNRNMNSQFQENIGVIIIVIIIIYLLLFKNL